MAKAFSRENEEKESESKKKSALCLQRWKYPILPGLLAVSAVLRMKPGFESLKKITSAAGNRPSAKLSKENLFLHVRSLWSASRFEHVTSAIQDCFGTTLL